jgi:hypothetical protein
MKKFTLIAAFIIPAVFYADVTPVAAPIVSVVFSNEGTGIENVLTLVQTGEYFGNKNAGAYYPQFIPAQGMVKRDSFAFDPGALEQGPNVYPFIFTYNGDIYYLVFVTSAILEEKTEFPFFASIIKVSSINQADNSAQISTIANLYFKQNDTLVVALQPQGLAFGNLTNKSLAAFVDGKQSDTAKKKVLLIPKIKPKRKVRLNPTTKPKPVFPIKPASNRVQLAPRTVPAPASKR